MKRTFVISGLLCSLVLGAAALAHGTPRAPKFKAVLSGANEVPAVDTPARGTALATIDPRGVKIHVEVTVKNITDVVQAHIHNGAAGVNGPVVAFLYGATDPAGPEKGLLTCRTITKADLVGPLAGLPLSALIEIIEAGSAYVNVHTTTHGPGEIRGQLVRVGRR